MTGYNRNESHVSTQDLEGTEDNHRESALRVWIVLGLQDQVGDPYLFFFIYGKSPESN